jgi:uncharacterized integral membrane protein
MTAAQNSRDRPAPNNGRPLPDRPPMPRSRVGGLWAAAVVFAGVLLLLLIFVLQNGRRVEVSFLGADGQLPLGVALLLAAVFGVLLVALPGTIRIVQLRVLNRRRGGPTAGGPRTGPVALPPDVPTAQQAHP